MTTPMQHDLNKLTDEERKIVAPTFQQLAAEQKPLEPEFAKVLNDNLFDLLADGDSAFIPAGLRCSTVYPSGTVLTFQPRVHEWVLKCLGEASAQNKMERNYRFLEEALELVQACGCTAADVYKLVDYVFGRPPGELQQEVGGVMVTLSALCTANKVDMLAAGETELARCWENADLIRARQLGKVHSEVVPAVDCSGSGSAEQTNTLYGQYDFKTVEGDKHENS